MNILCNYLDNPMSPFIKGEYCGLAIFSLEDQPAIYNKQCREGGWLQTDKEMMKQQMQFLNEKSG